MVVLDRDREFAFLFSRSRSLFSFVGEIVMGILTGMRPKKISDRHGRTWRLEFTEAAIERINGQTSFPLTNVSGSRKKILDGFSREPGQLIEILYAICEPQAESRGVIPEEFGRSFNGQQFCQAARVIAKELSRVQVK